MTTSLQNSLYVYNTQVVLNASVVHLAANQHVLRVYQKLVIYTIATGKKKHSA